MSFELQQAIQSYENYITKSGIDESVIDAMIEACKVAYQTEKDIPYALKVSARTKEIIEQFVMKLTGKWIFDSGREEPYTLSLENDLTISSLRYMDDFQILLMRLARARTSIIIDKDYDSDDIYPEAEPEASFS